jgi:hypothetical protein
VHNVIVYKELLTATANIIIQDEVSKGKAKETIYKFACENLPIENLIIGSTITISSGLNNLYAFNETEGAKAIDY